VSKPGDDDKQPERAAFKRLDRSVGRALGRLRELQARAEEAEGRAAELGELVKRFTKDEGEPSRMLTRLRNLEHENAELRSRLERGREAVERLLARIRFLEEQR
jgi:predicted RNase H-like nuclease (RuvC/YqgF family)